MSLRDGHPGESILASERALAIEPYSPNAWATLAAAQLAAGDVAAARASASRALELVHDYPFALDLRAKAATILHDVRAAQRDHDELMNLAASADDDDTRAAAQALLKGP
jgi:tetratricopeptide (TPR) repeat protein